MTSLTPWYRGAPTAPMCANEGHFFAALIAGLIALSPCLASAQEQGRLPAAFSSDRPGFANTPQIAAVARLTTEMGADAVIGDGPGEPRGQLPNLRLRVGLFDWLEARAILPSAVGDFGAGGPNFGLSDMVVGIKAGSPLAEGLLAAMVWDFTLPTATSGYGAPEALVTGEVILHWDFWGPLSLTPQATFTIDAILDEATGQTVRRFVGAFSLRFSWQIIDVLGVFVQSYATAGQDQPWGAHVGGGVYWQALPNWQLDAFFDSRVTDEGDPPTVHAGTTILW